MGIFASDIQNAINKIVKQLPYIRDELNAADARIGDGDTGIMIARLIEAFSTVNADDYVAVGDYLLGLAQVGAKSTGSSFGTLIISALMAVGKAEKLSGNTKIKNTEKAVEIARDAMIVRGRTAIGSKTVIDTLDYIIKTFSTGAEARSELMLARAAAQKALSDFRGQECLIGRARMFSEKTRGIDDPGMLAVVLLLDVLVSSS